MTLIEEQAAEIERLRAELAAMTADRDASLNESRQNYAFACKLHAERDALRAQLDEARKELRQIEADCEADYPPSPGALKYAIRDVLKMIKGGGDE